MGGDKDMALKSLIVKGKEYPASKITKVIIKEGKVFMIYLPSIIGDEKKIMAKLKDVEFVNEDGG